MISGRCLKTELSVIVMQYSCFETIFMHIIHICMHYLCYASNELKHSGNSEKLRYNILSLVW